MRVLSAAFLIFAINTLPAFAQSPEKCEGLDFENAEAIVSCLESDEMWFAARTKPQFEPNQKCSTMQYLVLKISVSATDPKAANRINSKTLSESDAPRPSCETLSEVVEILHGRPSSWSPCLAYDEAPDKFEHFTYCLPKYQQLRYNQPNRKIGKMDCNRAVATYQQALGHIYPPRLDQGEYYGRALPSTYVAPDCAKVDAFFEAVNELEMAELQKRYEEQAALKAKQKAEKEALAKEVAAKAKRAQEFNAKMDESYQNALDEMNEPALARMKSEEHPENSINPSNIRTALIREIWRMMPETRHQTGSDIVKLIHTTAGFKSWASNKMAPNVYHAVKDVAIKNCDVRNGKAHCSYDVTVSSSIDYHGMQNQQQREVYNKLGDIAGGGPRTISLQSGFLHNGKQWEADLTYDQAKQLLPPEARQDADKAAEDREKMNCDMLSAMGVPMLC